MHDSALNFRDSKLDCLVVTTHISTPKLGGQDIPLAPLRRWSIILFSKLLGKVCNVMNASKCSLMKSSDSRLSIYLVPICECELFYSRQTVIGNFACGTVGHQARLLLWLGLSWDYPLSLVSVPYPKPMNTMHRRLNLVLATVSFCWPSNPIDLGFFDMAWSD